MTIKVTYHPASANGTDESFPATGYYIKDGWIHITNGANQNIASVRESDVRRIDMSRP